MIWYIVLCALILFDSTDGNIFRFDYSYYQEAEGWLKLHHIPSTWRAAYLNCYYEGGVLASPENKNMLAALKRAIAEDQSRGAPCGVFTGVHATFGKGAYFSVEGTPLSRMPVRWAPDEPDNADNAEDCLLMLPNGTFADVNCSDVYSYICYRKRTKHMELGECGTVDKGYSFDKRTGSCYKVHTDPLNWSRAFVACAREGGHLAVINSEVEAAVIKELYDKTFPSMVAGKYQRDIAFLGFRTFEDKFLWMTVQGETLKESGYAKWSSGQPDQFGGHQDCGAMFRNGLLDDNVCTNVLPFICEKDPASLLNDDIKQ